MRTSSYVNILLLLLLSLPVMAQISINAPGFNVLSNAPIDTRSVRANLSDTTSITWTYEGLLMYAQDVDQLWKHNGSYWELFSSGGSGLSNFYISNDTLYAVSDSTFSIYLGGYDTHIGNSDLTLTGERILDAANNKLIFKDFYFEPSNLSGIGYTENFSFGNSDRELLMPRYNFNTTPIFDTTSNFIGLRYQAIGPSALVGFNSYSGITLDSIPGQPYTMQFPSMGFTTWVDPTLTGRLTTGNNYYVSPIGRYNWQFSVGTQTVRNAYMYNEGISIQSSRHRYVASPATDSVAINFKINPDSLYIQGSNTQIGDSLVLDELLSLQRDGELRLQKYASGSSFTGTAYKVLGITTDGRVVLRDTTSGGGATQLSDLTDVVSATNTNRFALMANGTTGYVGRALEAADIQSGTFADARISDSSVNQWVEDAAYGASWNGDLSAPTKNAVYDKIETIAAGSSTLFTDEAISSVISPDTLFFTGSTFSEGGLGLTFEVVGGDTILGRFVPHTLQSATTSDHANDELIFIDVSATPDQAKRIDILDLLGGSVTTVTPSNASTQDIDFLSTKIGFKKQIIMSSITSAVTLTFSNPVNGGEYLLHFRTVTGTDAVTFPANVYWMDETAVGTLNITQASKYVLYYDGTNYYME